METLPVSRLDFTAALPRVLSLYVMSFLNPRDLCAAAQVSWHWRFLAEQVGLEKVGQAPGRGLNVCLGQDCLWARRCVRRGWFLPYTPGAREYGAWKTHYIACVSTLDWLPPPNRLLGQHREETEEERERRTARKLRQTIRETIREEKSEKQTGSRSAAATDVLRAAVSAGASLRARRAWGSNAAAEAAAGGSRRTPSSFSGLLLSSGCSISAVTAERSSRVSPSPERRPSSSPSR